jgi:hypothetical protein
MNEFNNINRLDLRKPHSFKLVIMLVQLNADELRSSRFIVSLLQQKVKLTIYSVVLASWHCPYVNLILW